MSERGCERCGGPMLPAPPSIAARRRYCSAECSSEAARKVERVAGTCPHCRKPWTARADRVVAGGFCSALCKRFAKQREAVAAF